MANTIRAMSAGVGKIGEATGCLTTVASEQQATAELLDQCVGGAIERIDAMSRTTERLDRRSDPRAAASGTARLTIAGTQYEVTLLDISANGVRCLLEPGVALSVGDQPQLDLHIPAVTGTIRTRVARRDLGPDGDSIGLEFDGVTGNLKDQLAAYVRELLASEDEAARTVA